jgi:hypothetical protein
MSRNLREQTRSLHRFICGLFATEDPLSIYVENINLVKAWKNNINEQAVFMPVTFSKHKYHKKEIINSSYDYQSSCLFGSIIFIIVLEHYSLRLLRIPTITNHHYYLEQ